MEAKLVEELPTDSAWQLEPKWDGFRAICFRKDNDVAITSKAGKRLDRFFPELVQVLQSVKTKCFMIDGEIILPIGDILSFDALQARLHPAPSRIERLSRETPAQLMLFDCLAMNNLTLACDPLRERRRALEDFHRRNCGPSLLLSPASEDVAQARRWLSSAGGALDGVVAKRLEDPYRAGERAMRKVKQQRTADGVIGGFRRTSDGTGAASLLLGLYDEAGKLNHVGFTSAIAAKEKAHLLTTLEPLIEEPGFTGKAPGGPSRWNSGKEKPWEPLRPELVIEVVYDQVTGNRFRHGTKLLRWRPDKAPDQCDMEQLEYELRPAGLSQLNT